MLEGKRIIVTGAASGMGAAMLRDFVAHGASVVGLDIVPGGEACIRCDVSDEAQVSAAFARAIESLGGLWAVVNAAGVAPAAPAAEIDLTEWERVFAINTRGTFLTNRAAFPHLRAAGGRILNFASGAGMTGLRGKAHYSASKAAVLGWTRAVAREWAEHGITVNAIAPAIWTPMYEKTRSWLSPEQLAEHDAAHARNIPIGGKLGDAERDLAPVMRFMVSEESRFITGQIIAIDGGMTFVR